MILEIVIGVLIGGLLLSTARYWLPILLALLIYAVGAGILLGLLYWLTTF